METQVKNYCHTKDDDKHYFGGFFNLAQNNINNVIKEFCNRLNLPYSNYNIINYFKNNISHTDWERGINILKEYWPIIDFIELPITNKQFEDFKDSEKENEKRKFFLSKLKMLLKATNDLRNFYTHYYHDPLVLPQELYDFLDSTMLKTVIDTKKTKMKSDKTRQLLKDTLKDQIKILINLKKEELIEKKKNNPKISINDPNSILNAVYNDAFSHLLFTNKKNKKEELSQYYTSKPHENNEPISMPGLIFLLSFFLNRKEIEQFKSNIYGYKGHIPIISEITQKSNGLKNMATHWVFSNLAFKGVKHRITSVFSKETFMMQIVDELNKVPDEVYRTLSKDTKNDFLEDMNEYVSESSDEEQTPIYVVHPVIRKRYEDKFAYFAVRFLDEYANFPTLRFQVFAGRYNHDKRTKEIAGTTTTSERTIKERINIFGRLSEIVKLKNDYFHTFSLTNGWELFPNPSYNWTENNIPVYIDLIRKGEKAKEIQILQNQLHEKLKPIEQLKPINKQKKRISKNDIINIINNKQQKNITFGNPTFILSINELMSMLYEFLVNKKTGEEIENHIVKKITERYDLIQNFTPNNESKKNSKSILPKRILKSDIDEDYTDYNKLINAIGEDIRKGEAKIELIDRHQEELNDTTISQGNKKRKYLFYTSEMGKEATWIAKDITRFMPLADRKKWRGYHHSEFQRLISFYPTQRKEAHDLLTEIWNTNASSPYWNNLFDKLFDKTTFKDFYIAYLSLRNDILHTFLTNLENLKDTPEQLKKIPSDIYVVFHKRLYQIRQTQQQKEQLLAKPFVFPRGLFDDKPTVIKGFNPKTDPEKFANWYIYGYNYKGNFQKFYYIPKQYTDLYEKLSITKTIERFKADCDQKIKKIKFQDVYLKLIVDKLFEYTFQQSLSSDLSSLYDTPDERLNMEKTKNGNTENKHNETYFWNKSTTVSLYDGQIVDENIKLKDIGKFRKFLTDEKVETLLSYDNEKIWTKQQIEDELENKPSSYEVIRRYSLFSQIQHFEKEIFSNINFNDINQQNQFLKDGHPNFKMYVLNGVLKNIKGVSNADYALLINKKFEDIAIEEIKNLKPIVQKAFLLIYMRNKFAHNQLPQNTHFLLMQELYPSITVQDSYSEYFNKIIGLILADFK